MMRPVLGDRVKFRRGRNILEGTITAVSEIGVHYRINSKGRSYHIGLSGIVQILGADDE